MSNKNPQNIINELIENIKKLKNKIELIYDHLKKKGSKLPEHLKLRSKKIIYTNHKDENLVLHTGISIVTICTKYDIFIKNFKIEIQKVI